MKMLFNFIITVESTSKMRRNIGVLVVAGALAGFVGCGDDGGDTSGTGAAGGGGSKVTDAEIQAVVANYATNVHASYAKSLTEVQALRASVDAMVLNPSNTTQGAAKDAWNAARPTYLQTEVYRFYGGPIDDEETGPEGLINAWPLDEFYIDYVEGMATAGIINDPAGHPTISKETIAEANEAEGEKAISSGFHAIEFLLWGQDQSTTGPGARPFTDYVVGGGGTAANQDRRGLYIRETSALLEDNLTELVDAWKPGAENYAKTFNALPPREALGNIMTGMASLAGAELSTERMNNAYEEQDQEEEHSCFSDTTHVDHLNDMIGVENVYLGKFGSNDGPGVDELVAKVDPALDAEIKTKIAAAKAAIQAIPIPFDQAIVDAAPGGGREKIKAAIDALYSLSDSFVLAATALDVTLKLE